ncbi:MAG: polyphenol oxidase family protein [Longimicrobiales bacterium]
MNPAEPPKTVPPLERLVRERLDARVPALIHEQWASELPWLIQGTTTRGTAADRFDLGLFSEGSPAEHVRACWSRLLATTGMRAVMHARQVHEANVRAHRAPHSGLNLVEPCDGHTTAEPGVLLAVAIADCVPVFLVNVRTRVVGMLHAGWRGTAAGVLESGIEAMPGGSQVADLRVHFGPAICGACYEVGPEVFEALGEPGPATATTLDLRGVLFRRALAAGLHLEHVTVSGHCTRCTGSELYSHRGGDRSRQVGYLGVRP